MGRTFYHRTAQENANFLKAGFWKSITILQYFILQFVVKALILLQIPQSLFLAEWRGIILECFLKYRCV